MKRRVINFRCFLVVAVFVILTVFFALISYSVGLIGYILFALAVLAEIALFSVSFIFCEKRVYCITFLLAFIASVTAFISFNGILENWAVPITDGAVVSIEGTVDIDIETPEQAERIVVNSLQINGRKAKGKMVIYLSDYVPSLCLVRTGYAIKLSAKTYSVPLIRGMEVDGTTYRRDIRYKAYTTCSNVSLTPADANWNRKLLREMNATLNSALGHDYGGIAFSMLTGDRNYVSDTLSDYFSTSGLAHIMAVSGLHVGFLTVLLRFFFQKCRVNAKISVPIICAVLLFYAFLVGFSPSVMRAVIMCIVGLLTWTNGERKDILSSLCLAVTVILVIAPFYLFETGFILSVCAVFGLILFAPSIQKGLRKIKFPAFLADGISASVSVQMGIMPAMAYVFKQFQVYSILANILLLPLVMVTFIAILLTLPIAMLFPSLTILLQIAGIGISVLSSAAKFVALLPFSSILVAAGIGVFACYAFYFIASRYFMVPHCKPWVSLAALSVSLVLLVCPYMGLNGEKSALKSAIVPLAGAQDVTSLLIKNEQVYVVGDVSSAASVKQKLIQLHRYKIDAIYLFDVNVRTARQLADLYRLFAVKKIVCPVEGIDAEGLSILLESGVEIYAFEQNELPEMQLVYDKAKPVGYSFTDAEFSVLFMRYASDYRELPNAIRNRNAAIRSYMFLNAWHDRIFLTNMPADYLGLGSASYQFYEDAYPNFLFDYATGKLYT